MPSDALAYFSVDLDLSGDQWRQTQELLTRLGFPAALSDLRADILGEAGVADGSAPGDDPLFGGELAVVVSPPIVPRIMAEVEASGGLAAATPASPSTLAEGMATPVLDLDSLPAQGLAGILLPGDPDAAWEALRALDGADRESFDYDGIEIEFLQNQALADLGLGFGTEGGVALARLDDAILVAGSPADLEPIIDVGRGDARSLAEEDGAAEVRGRLAEEAILFGYFNGPQIGAALPPEAKEALAAFTPQYAGLGDAVYDIDSGLVLYADDPGFRLDNVQILPPGSPLLDQMPDNAEITAAERVPAGTFFFAAGNFPAGSASALAVNVAQVINTVTGQSTGQELDNAFAVLDPEYVEGQIAAADETIGFDLRGDLLGQVAGDYVLAYALPGFTGGGFALDGIVALDLDDEALVASSVGQIARRIASAGQADGEPVIELTTRQVDAEPLFVVQPTEALGGLRAEFGVIGDELLIGLGGGVDAYLKGPADSLADEPLYRTAIDALPEETSSVSFVNVGQLIGLLSLFDLIETGGDETNIDADPACGAIESQAAAQDAFDDDPLANYDLDQDFDGEACEDFFGGGTAVASPVAGGDLLALQALASVTYRSAEENVSGTSSILLVVDLNEEP